MKCYLLLTRQTEKPFSLQGCEKLFLKAIDTGIILFIMDIKKINFMYFFKDLLILVYRRRTVLTTGVNILS